MKKKFKSVETKEKYLCVNIRDKWEPIADVNIRKQYLSSKISVILLEALK